jgi:ABC-2 type transport system permease protein
VKPILALLRKHVHDTRGTLILSAAALFALGWLYVFFTSLNEAQILEALASDSEDSRFRWLRNMGMLEQPPTVQIIVAFWNSPFILLTIAIWAIARGSIAVGAEVERGTLDLIMSRPVTRSSYLSSHVLVAVLGLLFLALALATGATVGVHYNFLRVPPTFWSFVPPALNLAALGLPIYGYTLLVSSLDHVRWRPTMIGSILTLAGFIARVIAVVPVMQKFEWRVWLERVSIFKLFDPVDAVSTAESLNFNLAALTGIGVGCVVLAFLAFAHRDLPANG